MFAGMYATESQSQINIAMHKGFPNLRKSRPIHINCFRVLLFLCETQD